jgi:hypothetical protein
MSSLKIGWAEVDITPEELPVCIAGQFHARISEGITDPLKATALVLDTGEDHVVFVTVDTVSISEPLWQAVRDLLNEQGLDPQKVVLNATHTHEAPLNRLVSNGSYRPWNEADPNLKLDTSNATEYVEFASKQIASAVQKAWQQRVEGGIAYGLDYAVVGRNRRWFNTDGVANMYGLNENTADRFSHIEGYEDHSLNLMATYDATGNLTGLVVNVPSPSQEDEGSFSISADFWHETRQELRKRFGEHLFILPQCSAAGDQTSHLIFERAPHERMLRLRNRSARQEVAVRIADAVGRILPYIAGEIDYAPQLRHQHEVLQLPMNNLSEADVEDALKNKEQWEAELAAEKQKLFDDPSLQQQPRWYVGFTKAYSRAGWYQGVIDRYEKQKTDPFHPAEVHIIRLGDIAFATNPFEYYLDYGIRIKVQSPAMQTFLVQLAGNGTYIPSKRAADGGGYGAVPASNPVGAEGGDVLARYTVAKIRDFWKEA